MMRLDPIGKTLPQLLLERAERDGDRLAERHKRHGIWQRITWREIVRHVEEFANGLADLGLKRGQTVAIIGENEPELYQAEFAALAQGAVVVCLYPDLTAEEMEFILAHSEAAVIIAQDQEQVDKVLGIMDRIPSLTKIVYWDPKGLWSYTHDILIDFAEVKKKGRAFARAFPGAFARAVAEGRPEDIALRHYSSGTTGSPKGVSVSHAFVMDNVLRITSSCDLPAGAEYLSYISPAWGTEQMLGIALGVIRPLVVNFPERPETVLHDLREIGVEGVWFTPRQWESLASDIQARMLDAGAFRRWLFRRGMEVGAKYAETRLSGTPVDLWTKVLHPLAERFMLRPLRDKLGLVNVKLAVCGGAAMAPDVFRFFHSIGVPLRNIYGSTEFGFIAMHQGERFDLESVGKPMPVHPHYGPPMEWRISEDGELLVRGGVGFRGYHKLPEKTSEKLDGDWYRTGDHCAITDDGHLVFLERMEDLRTLASGHRYPPQYIETRLRYSPYIKDVLTVGDSEHPFVTALINIDAETVTRWAEERGIAFSTFADLSQKQEIRELIRSEIERVNRRLVEASQVRRFACLPKELDPDDGELTRTRKLRRGFIAERYGVLIGTLYGDTEKVDLKIPVRYQDGRRGELQAVVFVNTVGAAGLDAEQRLAPVVGRATRSLEVANG